MHRLLFSSFVSVSLALSAVAQESVPGATSRAPTSEGTVQVPTIETPPAPDAVPTPSMTAVSEKMPPNVIMIVVDDLGYSDLGCFGSKTIRTPNLDRMAAEGRKFTSFYVAQAVCSASRAAFMTGSYANRVSMQGALNHTSLEGIHPDEFLMPEMFKQ